MSRRKRSSSSRKKELLFQIPITAEELQNMSDLEPKQAITFLSSTVSPTSQRPTQSNIIMNVLIFRNDIINRWNVAMLITEGDDETNRTFFIPHDDQFIDKFINEAAKFRVVRTEISPIIKSYIDDFEKQIVELLKPKLPGFYKIPFSKKDWAHIDKLSSKNFLDYIFKIIPKVSKDTDSDSHFYIVMKKNIVKGIPMFLCITSTPEKKVSRVNLLSEAELKLFRTNLEKFRVPMESFEDDIQETFKLMQKDVNDFFRLDQKPKSIPDQTSFYEKDIDKPIATEHMHLQQTIRRKRQKMLTPYLDNPSEPLTNVSRKNRPAYQRQRRLHQQQLMKKYGSSVVPLPSQLHPLYREKIQQARKKLEQQRQTTQRQKMSKQQDYSTQRQNIQKHAHDKDYLEDKFLWRQLGLIDPITHQVIEEPVRLPSSSLVDAKSVPFMRNIDPITNEPITGSNLNVRKDILKSLRKIRKEKNKIMTNPNMTIFDRILGLVGIRNKWMQDINVKRRSDVML